MLTCTLAMAQRDVSGRVVNEKGDAIPFASVKVKGKNTGTSADGDGKFSFKANIGETIIVSYQKIQKEYDIKNLQMGDLSLNVLNKGNELVTVTGTLGRVVQKKELGYSTAKISNDLLTQSSPISIASGLQGKVSGVNIATINNGVFADVKINLRGIRSLTGDNNPMFLLDGSPTPISYLASINPNDIIDLNIIKGSAGAGIYGPEARNGVIIVTTKKGGRTEKATITVSNTTQLEKIAFLPKFQTQFGSGGYGDFIPYENWSWGPAYDGAIVDLGRPLADGSQQKGIFTALPGERQAFFNTGITTQNDLSFAVKDFFLSVQDANIKGSVPDDVNRRTGIRVNASKEYGRIKIGYGVNYIQTNYNIFDDNAMSNYNTANNVGLNGGLMNLIFNTPAHIPITSYKDFKNNPYAGYNGYFNDYGLNPYFAIDNWRLKGRNDEIISNLNLNFKVNNWLNLTWRGSGNARFDNRQSTSKGEIPSAYARSARSFKDVPGTVTETSIRTSRVQSEFYATASKSFNNIKVGGVLGHSYRQDEAKTNRLGVSNLVVPELYNVGNRTGEIINPLNTFSLKRLNAVYGSLNFGYKGWANVEVTGRYEQTSVLDNSSNSYFYPGVNVSLVLSEAIEALQNSNTISYLKLRALWNKTANAEIAPYSLSPTFGQASGFPYGSLAGFTAGNRTFDPLLKPEFIDSKELGFELSLLKNKINLEVSAYKQDNTDQIIPISLSSTTGYTSANVNAASFINKGLEIDLKLTPFLKLGDFNFSINANASYNTTEVTKVFQGLDRVSIGGFTNLAENFAIVGQPAYVFLATDYLRDNSGHVIVNSATGYPSKDPTTRQFGRSNPLWTLGLSPTLRYKGLSFSVVGEYKGGHSAYNSIGNDMAWTGVSAATAKNGRQRFVFPNSVIADPANPGKYITNTNVTVSNVNDFYTGVFRDVASNFITSAASWRIREVALSYDFNMTRSKLNKVIKGASVSVNARNLFLWVPKSNEYSDPDFNFTSGNVSGVTTSQINPPTRIIGANLTITF
jgi:TonB-linked SusC/RagA family outer membrane protein